MTRFLGGAAGPLGWCVQFLQAPRDDVVAALRQWGTDGRRHRVTRPSDYPAALEALLPFESPWSRCLVMPHGAWTAILNNATAGGDPSAPGPALARRLGVRCVTAQHRPRYGPGHQDTQLWVEGPDGVPPLMYERTLCAVAEDGRWHWYASGTPFAFERLERYESRLIRDRFDRPLLLGYLAELGISMEDRDFGPGVIVQQRWRRRRGRRVGVTRTLEEERRRLGLT